jgi:O-antigen/teichoic acid export membrane protein
VLSYLIVGADAGLTTLAVREIARRPDGAATFAGPILVLRLVIALPLLVIAVIVVAGSEPTATAFYAVAFAAVIPYALSLVHVAQGREHLRAVAVVRAIATAGAGIIGLLALVVTRDLLAVVVPVVIVGLLVDLALIRYVRRKLAIELRVGTINGWGRLLRTSSPFLVAAIAIQLISNADAVIIGTTRGEAQLGEYAAAYLLAGQLLFLSGPIAAAIYPRLAALHGSRQAFTDSVRLIAGLLGIAIVPFCVGGALVAPKLIGLIYGAGYEGSVALLAILLGMPLLGFYNVAIAQALNAAGAQVKVARVAVGAAIFNVVLNVMLVTAFGLLGAAVTAVLTEGITLIAYTLAAYALIGVAPLKAYAGALPAAAGMALSVFVLVSLGAPLPLIVVSGAVIYSALLLLHQPEPVRYLRAAVGI